MKSIHKSREKEKGSAHTRANTEKAQAQNYMKQIPE
jgi:hypothetical protein